MTAPVVAIERKGSLFDGKLIAIVGADMQAYVCPDFIACSEAEKLLFVWCMCRTVEWSVTLQGEGDSFPARPATVFADALFDLLEDEKAGTMVESMAPAVPVARDLARILAGTGLRIVRGETKN